jgi:mannose-6-phosphate isomerase-like protein (cupin superfamily)
MKSATELGSTGMTAPRKTIDLKFSPVDFTEHYENRSFKLQHDLQHHPLFSWGALFELAQRLRPEFIELNEGNVPTSMTSGGSATHGLSATETLRRIEECSTWLGLKRIETIPEYRDVLEGILEQLRPHIDSKYPGMHSIEGFVFVTSPNSTVPFHMDPEHNFLFQLQGNKHFVIFPREALTEQHFEQHYVGWQRRMELSDQIRAHAHDVLLEPGQALHVPINSPHFVRNENSVSISVSITFQTPAARRRELVYKVNGRLRKLGWDPTPYGRKPWSDRCKVALYESLVRVGAIRLSGRRN